MPNAFDVPLAVPSLRKVVVYGVPQSKGSTRAFRVGSRIVTTSTNRNLRDWSLLVAQKAQESAGSKPPMTGPVSVVVACYLPRPKSVRRKHPTVKPDLDKLVRAVLDPLHHVWFGNDSQIVRLVAEKAYSDQPRVEVTAWEIGDACD